jgi:pathogenicity locus Cdd1 protein
MLTSTKDIRELKDLCGVGPATLRDLKMLSVQSVADLAERDGKELYDRLCHITGVQHDPCCLDVFRCAVAQARDPELPAEQCNWWYWSRLRKKKAPAWPL